MSLKITSLVACLPTAVLVLVLLSNFILWLKFENQLFALYFIQVSVERMLHEEGKYLMSERQMMRFLFTPGCHSFLPRLPEQHGVRLETAELHRGHPWGKHTLAGIWPPGFLRPVTDNRVVIIAPVGMRDVCLAIAAAYCWPDWLLVWERQSMKTPTLMFSLHFSRTAVKSSLSGRRGLHFTQHMTW